MTLVPIDIATVATPRGVDWQVTPEGNLAMDYSLSTLVLHTLFSDARDPDAAPLQADPHGWWAERPGETYGSLLWLLRERKATAETRTIIEDEARTALERSLVQTGIAEAVEVVGTWRSGSRLDLEIAITRGQAQAWPYVWETPPLVESLVGGYRLYILAR